MMSIDAMEALLEKIALEVPEPFFRELNGGISLLPEAAAAPESVEDDLFLLGEYCADELLGRYILIYYGSFAEVFGDDASDEEIEAELRETLFHEFTHHLESLAGEDGLGEKDAAELEAYLESWRQRR